MMTLFLILIVQLIIAGVVIVVLKNLLDKELKEAAIEKFSSLKGENKIDVVNVYYVGELPLKLQEELKAITNRKFVDSKIVFEENQILKGGLVIVAGQEVLDFSITSRLENFWS